MDFGPGYIVGVKYLTCIGQIKAKSGGILF